MLKKSIAILLLLTVIISMVACTNKNSISNKTYTDTVYPDEYESPTPPAPPETTDTITPSNSSTNN